MVACGSTPVPFVWLTCRTCNYAEETSHAIATLPAAGRELNSTVWRAFTPPHCTRAPFLPPTFVCSALRTVLAFAVAVLWFLLLFLCNAASLTDSLFRLNLVAVCAGRDVCAPAVGRCTWRHALRRCRRRTLGALTLTACCATGWDVSEEEEGFVPLPPSAGYSPGSSSPLSSTLPVLLFILLCLPSSLPTPCPQPTLSDSAYAFCCRATLPWRRR